MPWARASQLDRHIACPAASWLPRADRGTWKQGYLVIGELSGPPAPIEERDTSAADWGTAMHAAKASLESASDPWLTMWEPWREKLYPQRLGRHEVAISYDCSTRAIEVYQGVPGEAMDAWKETRGRDCVSGQMDWLGALPTDEPWVDDLKTGWKTPEVITAQTSFYALVAARLAKADSCRVSITHWPKKADEPTREGLWRQLTMLHLDAFEEQLHRAWLGAIGLSKADPDWRGQARPGPHCKYCPSVSVCPRAND